MVYGLFKSTCVTWTLELALPWIIHNAGIELPLARKIVLGYSPSHETGCLQTELIQPMVKIARIHRPLPVDCLFPSHKGFSSLASSPVANSTQLNNIFSEHAGALADTTKPSMPWGLDQSSQKGLPWLKYTLDQTLLPHIRIQAAEEPRSGISHQILYYQWPLTYPKFVLEVTEI